MKNIYKLFFLTCFFVFSFGISVFALDYSSVPHTVTITGTTYTCDASHSVASISNNSTNFMFGLPGSGLLSINKGYSSKGNVVVNGQTYECFVGFQFSPLDWHSDSTGTSLVVAQALLTEYLNMVPDVPDSFDPFANSTLEGFNRLGFVGGFGLNSRVVNSTTNLGQIFATCEEDNLSFTSVDSVGQEKFNLLEDDSLSDVLIQFAYKGFGTYRVTGFDDTIGTFPISNIYYPLYDTNVNSHVIGDTVFNDLGLSKSLYFKLTVSEWFKCLVKGRESESYNFASAKSSVFEKNAIISARYIGVDAVDGHYIYGPWTDDKIGIDDKVNTVPDNPSNTVKKTTHTIIRNEPTENPDIDIPIEFKPEFPSTVYYPSITINNPSDPSDPSADEDQITVNVTVNDINGNLVNQDLLYDNTLDTSTLQNWTSQLVESVKNVPLALAGLFSFYEDWVLIMFTVCFGLLVIFKLIK